MKMVDTGKLSMVLISIIGVIVMVNFVTGIVSPTQSGLDGIYGKDCADAGYFWNTTGEACQAAADNQTAISGLNGTALGSLYSRTGIFFIVMLAGALLVAIYGFMRIIGKH